MCELQVMQYDKRGHETNWVVFDKSVVRIKSRDGVVLWEGTAEEAAEIIKEHHDA